MIWSGDVEVEATSTAEDVDGGDTQLAIGVTSAVTISPFSNNCEGERTSSITMSSACRIA